MEIRNKKNMANYVNYKIGGFAKKSIVPAGKTINIPEITNENQIINFGDFQRGFFEIIVGKPIEIETKEVEKASKKVSKKTKKKEDSLEKVEKEVKDYTEKDNK